MLPIYVLGGQAKQDAAKRVEWHSFDHALILKIDPGNGRAETMVAYRSPADACPDYQPSIIFKAGSLRGDLLYACTQTEVLTYQLPSFRVTDYLSLPCFNDLHHVAPTSRGTLLIALTGLDMVLEVTPNGHIVREWDVVSSQPWQRFSRAVDYRKVATTKPHLAHPNYLFELGDEVWVTRFVQRDAICLTHPDKRIDIATEPPHDGVVANGKIYFTTVDGHIVIADAARRTVVQVFDLRKLRVCDQPLGWCRALKVLAPDRLLVGFSRLRVTSFTENLAWVKRQAGNLLGLRHQFEGLPLPTRLWGIDLSREEIFWEFNLEQHGMHAVFSIH